MYYIYRHTLPDGKRYIGKTTNPKQRFYPLKYKQCTKLYNAIKLYKWETIKTTILYETENPTLARKLEKLLIAKYDSIENGYNSFCKDYINDNKVNINQKIWELLSERHSDVTLCMLI